MRITRKDIERLEYVERALNSKENHLAKVVHNILQELNPEFIYILEEKTCRHTELAGHTEAYTSFAEALNSFKTLVKNAKADMLEYIPEKDQVISEQIDEENQAADFMIYSKNRNISLLHTIISIRRKELI